MSSLSVADVIERIPREVFHHAVALPLYIQDQKDTLLSIASISISTGLTCQVGKYYLDKLGAPLMMTAVMFQSVNHEDPQERTILQQVQVAALAGIMHYALLTLNPFSRVFGATIITTAVATAVVLYPTYWKSPDAAPAPSAAQALDSPKQKAPPRFSRTYQEFANHQDTCNKVQEKRKYLTSHVNRVSASLDGPKNHVKKTLSTIFARVTATFISASPPSGDAPANPPREG